MSKPACYSCVRHGQEAHLHVLPSILDFLWRKLFFDFPSFHGLLPLGLALFDCGLFFIQPVLLLFSAVLHFLPYHSVIPTVMLFDPSLLGLFGSDAYSSLNDSL